jgi:hypothetical protein
MSAVCEIETFAPVGAAQGSLLIEIPHGATRTKDYEAVEKTIKSDLPRDLIHFFYVNTDIGTPECAAEIATTLRAQGFAVTVVRCLIPRTFIDTNRVIQPSNGGALIDGMTPGLPGYIDMAKDGPALVALHAEYHAQVAAAYADICGKQKGLALQLHSFAPRSVEIAVTDANIVNALHAAYQPEVYATWKERPPVDFISALADGSFSVAPALVASAKAAYEKAGIAAAENATYHMHPATMGLFYARAYPTQVLCVEINRGLISEPFVPFGESPISPQKVARLTAPLSAALAGALTRR